MSKFIKKILITVLIIIFITIITLVIIIQPYLFFHPWHDVDSYNQLLKEEGFEELKIDNNGRQISGWIKHNAEQQAPLLIFFGGNAQNSSNAGLAFLKSNKYQYFSGYNLMLIDYPGYGLSEGKTSDESMYDMALKTYDYAIGLNFVNKNKIVTLGYSIGTGVATYLASQRKVSGLILVAPYDDALSLYNDNLNIFHGPLKLLARYKFDSKKYAQGVTVAPLIITSYADEVINYKHSLNLVKYFREVSKIITLSNGTRHNNYFLQENVLQEIHSYLQERI